MTINERLFKEMNERGLNPADLCRHLGIRSSVTSGWKTRKTDPPAKYVIQIANFLGCSVEYLLTGNNTKIDSSSFIQNPKEQQLIDQYRALSDKSQDIICNLVDISYKSECASSEQS